MDLTEHAARALAPRYVGLDLLGEGGSSMVFRATDTRHDRTVAVKVLHPERWGSVQTERFLREVRLAASLEHPNVLPLFDSGEADGLHYYTMPFVSGESLRARIRREGPLSVEDAIEIVRDVATGLAHAHRHGLIHRDVKPGNILLGEGRAVIADFGIARAMDVNVADRLTGTGDSPGTPAYMSPEHAGDDEVDARSDVYSLGCVLYECLVGEPPFRGRTVQAVVARHMFDAPPSISTVRRSVPAGVVMAVEKALEKVPADRFQTADAFADALVHGLQDDATSRPRRSRLRPMLWTAGTVAAAATIGLSLIPPGPELDPQRVVGFPLVRVGAPDPDALGWNVSLAIGTALEHTDPVRWIDGWLWLPEEVRSDPARITPRVSRSVATARGAGRYVGGFIRDEGDSIAITLSLHDTESGDPLAQETVRAAAGTPLPRVGLDAIVRLLPSIVEPGRSVDLSPLTDRSPAAVALTIQGDRAYRGADFVEALDFYRRAVEEDSLMAIAAARGARAASWSHDQASAIALSAQALRHESLLPPGHRAFARGVGAFQRGFADSAVVYLDEALATDPDWAEASALLGETYFHLFPGGGAPVEAALEAFEHAIEADSAFTPPYMHLTQMRLNLGESEEARGLIRKLADLLEPGAGTVHVFERMLECVEGERDPAAWRAAAAEDASRVLSAGLFLSSRGAFPDCALLAYDAVAPLGQALTWGSILGRQSVLLAQGRVVEARTQLDSLLADGYLPVYYLYTFNAGVTPAFREKADEAVRLQRDAFGPTFEGANPLNSWLATLYLAERDEPGLAGEVAETVRRYTGGASRMAVLVAEALDAHDALLGGEPEIAAERFADLTPSSPPGEMFWSFNEALAPEWIRYARLLLQMERHDQALRVAATFDRPGPFTYVAYLAPSLEIRARAAEALGRPAEARGYRDRLRHLGWPDGAAPLSMHGPLLHVP